MPLLQAGVTGVQDWMNWDLLGLSWLSFVEKPIFSRLLLTGEGDIRVFHFGDTLHKSES